MSELLHHLRLIIKEANPKNPIAEAILKSTINQYKIQENMEDLPTEQIITWLKMFGE